MIDASYAMSGHTPDTAINANRCRDTNDDISVNTRIVLPTLTGSAVIASILRTDDGIISNCSFVPMLDREAILDGAYVLHDIGPGEIHSCRSEILRSTAWRLLCAAEE